MRVAVAALALIEALVGALIMLFAQTVPEVAGGVALIGAAMAGVYGLLHKLAEDSKVTDHYETLLSGLQRDNDRLREALRQCEERS